MEREPSKHTFPALTGIRALAAYLVYLHHTNPFSSLRFGNFLHQLVNQFHIGVSIFFVLSGFLITYRYYETSGPGKPWFRNYLKNRVARVYPMYFILTSVTMIVFIIQGKNDAHPLFTYLMNITFLRGFFDDLKFSLISQGWSLTVEECFYLIAPILFIGFRKSKWYLLTSSLVLITLGCLLVIVFSSVNFYGFFNHPTFLFTYTFPGRCAEFMMGAALAILFSAQLNKALPGIRFTLLGSALIPFILFMMTLLNMKENSFNFLAYTMVQNILLPFAVTFLFYGLIREKTWLSAWLSSRLMLLLGKSSYTFYLIHIGILYTLVSRFSGDFLVTFLIMNLMAVSLWYSLEEPLNRLIRRF